MRPDFGSSQKFASASHPAGFLAVELPTGVGEQGLKLGVATRLSRADWAVSAIIN